MGETPRGLIALIFAYHELEDAAGGLRAGLSVAGRSLLERQGRIAAAAGAEALVIVGDPAAAPVAAGAERLKAAGLQVIIARDLGEAARAVEADDRILFIGDGALVEENEAAPLAEVDGYALLTVPDAAHDDRFERIDADSRWAGVAMIDGRLVRHTAPMLQDWDMQSTLLRRAVQEGARYLRVSAEAAPIIAEHAADVQALEDDILRGAAGFQRDWVSRYLLGWPEAEATRRLIRGRAKPLHLFAGALALQVASSILFAFAWKWPGLILFLLSTPMIGIGERLGRLCGTDPFEAWLRRAMPYASGAALLALGYADSLASGWGASVLAVAALAFCVAAEGEHPRRTGRGLFFAEAKGMGWLLLPFAALGHWTIGLGALSLYAAGTFFIAQRRAHGGRRLRPED